MHAFRFSANSPISIETARRETVKKQSGNNAKPTGDAPDISYAQVGGLSLLTSLFAFFYYYQHNDLLLYGDAVAHINIARRVFDSQTPGLLQLGTVWLPLPHVLMIPFVFADKLWQNGAGGSFPSMVAYVFAVVGIFRFTRQLVAQCFPEQGTPGPLHSTSAMAGGWIAALVFGANPNLIYLQATAMTESLYLCFFIWAVVFFAEFIVTLQVHGNVRNVYDEKPAASSERLSWNHPLTRCALALAAAECTRYDGWFLAGTISLLAAASSVLPHKGSHDRRVVQKSVLIFIFGCACAPVLWLVYNRVIYGSALEFATGAFSAKAIELRVNAPNPALHNIFTAATYFLKSAQLSMAPGNGGRLWIAAAVGAIAIVFFKIRSQAWSFLCLLAPIPFYAYSIAYGSVPIHVSAWWPFTPFNQRYGLQLLPLFAVSAGLLAVVLLRLSVQGRHRWKIISLCLALVVFGYGSAWKAEPVCFTEARKNWALRYPLNSSVQRLIATFPSRSVYLMDLSEHVGIMEQAGIPLRQVINSENRRLWMRPTDPEGLWERALADPAKYSDYVIAFDGDMVDRFAAKTGLAEYAELRASGQATAKIYVTGRQVSGSH